MKLSLVEKELIQAKPVFQAVSPGWMAGLRGKALKVAKRVGIGLMGELLNSFGIPNQPV